MSQIYKKIISLFKKHGFLKTIRLIIQKIKNISSSQQTDIFTFYNYINFPKVESRLSNLDKTQKNIWFIPDFGIGSGGHLNIFRMIYNLERLGIESDLVICGRSQWINEKMAKETIANNFFPIKSNIFFVNTFDEIQNLGNYKIAFATSWQSAYYVNAFGNCMRKAYFVQDFEPYFYPVGSNYMFAENTYKFGFEGVTAGSWLSNKLSKEYGMMCIDFSFSYEDDLYYRQDKKDTIKRVFFYARPPTDRRGFELGIFALNELYKRDSSIEIILAGWDVSEYTIPFQYKSLGVVDIEDLSNIYSQCNVALVLSFTNLSLLPLELLASGCPVVINEGENNSWIDRDKRLMIYTPANVESIITSILDVLNNNLSPNWEYIDKYLTESSWEKESQKVFNMLLKFIKD